MSVVLVVAPHPDDETLGCGGTILRHKQEGDEVHWLIMTTIEGCERFSEQKISDRRNEIKAVADEYQFSSVHHLDFKSTELDQVSKNELIGVVSKVISDVQPAIIYMPYRNDIHSDHEVVVDTLASCTKSFRYPFIKKIFAYETLSETEFNIRPGGNGFMPNAWVNITNYLDKKIEIMNLYQGETGVHPFPRSEENIRALATYRGARAGHEFSEAFMILQDIR